ncbi:MAG: hypothetical protein G01um101448_152 [Parcubacteria group bacterium Gr01-1014_48]|nr:MAG: hypothetical protein Greene041614_107 [Parcubacteria group bacterium Greene0416_14]TSC74425.1 MAG: hypothetical protein G01um101448_152 [Parcubacteria group bacterium Gr01-1014_48]TSD01278.1 MAG: hypothetical protein Greene101415_367 [Parcubacteria group bacterium Greene1014_15]TSD08401.1 MAG: hypothetical protein Greene07144_117 [Parcubacteria group bacterium Greene0714_4]
MEKIRFSLSRRFVVFVFLLMIVSMLLSVFVVLDSRERSVRYVSAKTIEITKACQRPLDEYVLRAEQLLNAVTPIYNAQNGTNQAIGYLLLHNICASKSQ